MKNLLPSFLLSFFSFPLAYLLGYIYFFILPSHGSAESLISIVISLNTISLIIALYTITKIKKSS